MHEQVQRAGGARATTCAWCRPRAGRRRCCRAGRAYREVPGVDVVEGVPVLYPRKLDPARRPAGAPQRRRDAAVDRRAPARACTALAVRRDPRPHAGARRLGGGVDGRAPRACRWSPPPTAPTCSTCPRQGPRSRRRVEEAVAGIDQVCAVSARDRRRGGGRWRRRGGRCEVVPNGADTARLHAPARRGGARPPGPARRRPDRQLRRQARARARAWTRWSRRWASWPAAPAGAPLLVAAGIGELRPALERRAAELGVADRVRFVGKVAHDEVGWWMARGRPLRAPVAQRGPAHGGVRGDELRPARWWRRRWTARRRSSATARPACWCRPPTRPPWPTALGAACWTTPDLRGADGRGGPADRARGVHLGRPTPAG